MEQMLLYITCITVVLGISSEPGNMQDTSSSGEFVVYIEEKKKGKEKRDRK